MSEVVKSEYQLMDAEDELQIIASDEVKQALVYATRGGKKSLSGAGIKFLFQKICNKDHLTVEIVDEGTYCNLEKDDPDDKSTWHWRAQCKIRVITTNPEGNNRHVESVGQSENSYLFSEAYDTFGRTKAASKAERNAIRKQIPEFEITFLMNKINPGDVKTLEVDNSSTTVDNSGSPTAPTTAQLNYLKNLGHKGIPKTKFEAGKLISELKEKK